MRVTVIREGNALRLIDSTEPIPEGATLVLYTADEIARLSAWTACEAAQLDSVFRDDDEDWGDSLDALVVKQIK
jgi:hypothetical protein